MNLLEIEGLSVVFGGVAAVDDVSFAVAEGALVGLIGPNGAGKTTTIEAVTGFVQPAAGVVRFLGSDVTGLPPHRRARLGLVRTFQSVELFDDLTVRDNLRAAANRRNMWRSIGDLFAPRWHGDEAAVDRALDVVGLRDAADTLPNELSQGQRKLAGVARALACRPRLVLLDEPAAGLDATETMALGQRLRDVVDDGVAILLVDHDMGLVLGTCDRIVVLDFGRVLADGTPEQIRRDDHVVAAYLGNDAVEQRGEHLT
jgi:branched-chain amino acid transport system ATP-binding protein